MSIVPAAEELFQPRSLAEVSELRRIVDRVELELVLLARRQGFTWAEIGGALGVSAQAAHRRLAAAVAELRR